MEPRRPQADDPGVPGVAHPTRALIVHVECDRAGRWAVRRDTDAVPVSVHGSATEAEQAALALAGAGGEIVVLLHDRYGRVRQTPGRGRFAR